MGALAWLGRGGRLLVGVVGLLVWLIVTVVAAYTTVQNVYADTDFDQIARQIASATGVVLMMIGAPIGLWLSRRFLDFGLMLAFGAITLGYGAGVFEGFDVPLAAAAIIAGLVAVAVFVASIAADARGPRWMRGVAIATLIIFPIAAVVASMGTQFYAAGPPAASSEDLRAELQRLQAEGRLTPEQAIQLAETLEEGAIGPGALEPAAPNGPAPVASDFHIEELRFNRPERMRINRSYVVEAQIGATQPLSIADVGPVVSREVAVPDTRLVQVELVSDDFEIVKLHSVDSQLVAPGGTGVWTWRVTPRREGEARRLLLQVYGVLRREGYEGQALVRTYEESIPVDVTPIDRVQMIAQAFLAHWKVLAGLVGALGGMWVFINNVLKFIRERRRRAEPQPAA